MSPSQTPDLVQIVPSFEVSRASAGSPGSGPLPSRLDWTELLEQLRAWILELDSAVVAYSGGVDSSVVLRVAVEQLGHRALGVIGRSDSYAAHELTLALDQAASFGARVETVATGELSDPDFRSNPLDRCYHCKSELYRKLAEISRRENAVILDGTIHDDLADWRPGRRAAAEHEVRSPLAELGFTKDVVRQVAKHFGLESQDKPAAPCLASRIPYGTEITRANLGMVEGGEELLRRLGFRELRLRHHGEVARIEIAPSEFGKILDPSTRSSLVAGLKSLGYRHVALDLEGFRSGSLNPDSVKQSENKDGTQPDGRGI